MRDQKFILLIQIMNKYSDILKKNQGKTIKDLNSLCDNIIVIGFYQNDQRHNLAWNKLIY